MASGSACVPLAFAARAPDDIVARPHRHSVFSRIGPGANNKLFIEIVGETICGCTLILY